MTTPPRLTIVTTCKGRWHTLSQTLLTYMSQPRTDVVLVDYGCPNYAGKQAKARFTGLKVIEAQEPGFNLAAARNLGASAVQTEYVAFVDCDVKLREDFSGHVLRRLADKPHARLMDTKLGCLTGTTALATHAWQRVSGYDEAINTYGAGYEDVDFYSKLGHAGYITEYFAPDMLTHIEHEGRVAFYELKDRELSDLLNFAYMRRKHNLLALSRNVYELPWTTRAELYEHTALTIIGILLGETTTRQEQLDGKWTSAHKLLEFGASVLHWFEPGPQKPTAAQLHALDKLRQLILAGKRERGVVKQTLEPME